MKCEKCGHTTLLVKNIPVENGVPDVQFSEINSEEYTTLFLAKTHRSPVTSLSVLNFTEDFDLENLQKLYKQDLLPVIEKLRQGGIELIGHLAKPSAIRLAISDLAIPFCIFEFVTVKKTPDLEEKLQNLGLSKLLKGEGQTETIG